MDNLSFQVFNLFRLGTMLNHLIRFSLRQRLLILCSAVLLLVWGGWVISDLPVDVLPDLNRPRVTIFLEANGMAPEEVETQVVLPVETALNGAPGVEGVRSTAGIGLGLIYIEFEWGTDIYRARQMVSERLQSIKLPEGIVPALGPVSSIMGQIMNISLSADSTDPASLRTIADFTIRRRLMGIKGVSQVISIGGERLQYQVLVSSQRLKQYSLTIDDVEHALELSSNNSSGGFINSFGSEVYIRNVARARSLEDLRETVISNHDGLPVLLSQVADVRFGAAQKRGDAGVNGKPAVILTVEKQPNANTVWLTEEVEKALKELEHSLPPDVVVNPEIFQQKSFIEHSLTNVEEALRDGFILVVIILFLFLLNIRTTLITLTAIPLSMVISAIVFYLAGISINTLTLGGIAIAIGELVDDAIVDVENVFRRLKENRALPEAQRISSLQVVFNASSEVRNSIVYATVIVVLVFLPLFWLEGIEGRIFAPLGIAYITSILASLLVSLTVTPAMCAWLLGDNNSTRVRTGHRWWQRIGAHERDSGLVRALKSFEKRWLHHTLSRPGTTLGIAGIVLACALALVPFFGSEFLPPFNEGSFMINLYAPAGTSLEESNRMGTIAEKILMTVPELESASRRTGRAEMDEHTEPVSSSEIDVVLKAETQRDRQEIISDIRQKLEILKGVTVEIGQPISHRVEHLMSGVKAQVAVKLFGTDLNQMRLSAARIAELINGVDGAVDIQVERQQMVPQLLITVDREALKRYGLQAGKVARDLEIFYNGIVTGQILDGQKTFDILLRTTDEGRTNPELIRQTLIDAPDGTLIPLERIADIEYTYSVNSIAHENAQRKIFVSCNVQGRDLGSTVEEIKARIGGELKLPPGAYIEYGGQYEAQQRASSAMLWMSLLAFAGIFVVLYSYFRTWRIVLQVMLSIPMALIGSVVAVWLTGGTFSVATLVGFITLTGIASRNGIMMISHYIHLVKYEGETFSRQLIERGTLERLVPVTMTALVAALALIPLTLDAQAPGKEILYPVATVILGGLISSTLLDMLVRPALFWKFGKRALDEYFSNQQEKQ
ncbi:MAG: efflux RND transporter permease subunit [Flavobacteriales bacterium]|nr:efflux RND transporter permease subunit [Flavobacteriales bacterium]